MVLNQQAENYKNKGNEEFKAGNHAKAIEFYTYATEMDPKNHLYFTNRSFAYFNMKVYDKSLRDADKALKIKSDWEKGHWRRANALLQLKQLDQAYKSFQECVKLVPSNQTFIKGLAGCKKEFFKDKSEAEILKMDGNELFKAGKGEDAIKKYTEALKAAKESTDKEKVIKADILANRAACYRQLYLDEQVRDDCTAALALVPGHAKALIRRAQAYESLEKYKAAIADYQAVLKVDRNAKIAFTAVQRLKKALASM